MFQEKSSCRELSTADLKWVNGSVSSVLALGYARFAEHPSLQEPHDSFVKDVLIETV